MCQLSKKKTSWCLNTCTMSTALQNYSLIRQQHLITTAHLNYCITSLYTQWLTHTASLPGRVKGQVPGTFLPLLCLCQHKFQINLKYNLTFMIFKASALYKSKCLSVSLSVCPCVCSYFEVPSFCPPPSWSRMCKIFRDSEFLVKSSGKKWGQILSFFSQKWSQIAAAKFFFLRIKKITFEVPFNRLFVPSSWNQMSKIFKDSESLGEK